MDKIENQPCPFCKQNKMTMTEEELEIPYFGKCFLFALNCSACGYKMSDVEAEKDKEPVKIIFTVENEKDMKVRVVKSSNATVSVPQLRMKVSPGPASEGYISNIEGILDRFKKVVEDLKETAEEDEEKREAKNLLKKIWKVRCGDVPLKIIIEDPSGNSAIISEKASILKLKK
ncbi:ZPR1 zinc finger domain-containing protein [Candidatus Woesearchaeota archaeon]|nr:ZPR1 zinc finger domain-containing protein [Candidatus Woesearchaeota archaeon]